MFYLMQCHLSGAESRDREKGVKRMKWMCKCRWGIREWEEAPKKEAKLVRKRIRNEIGMRQTGEWSLDIEGKKIHKDIQVSVTYHHCSRKQNTKHSKTTVEPSFWLYWKELCCGDPNARATLAIWSRVQRFQNVWHHNTYCEILSLVAFLVLLKIGNWK